MRSTYLLSTVLLLMSQMAAAGDRDLLEDELDIFAAALFDEIQVKSITENVEYCGYLGFDADGELAATDEKRGEMDSCLPDDPPPGFEVLASYHTHGAYTIDADTEVPSLDDLQGDIEEDIDGYIATPGGRIWLNLAEEQISILLCGPGCVTYDQSFRACPAYPPGEEYTLAGLVARAENDPGDC